MIVLVAASANVPGVTVNWSVMSVVPFARNNRAVVASAPILAVMVPPVITRPMITPPDRLMAWSAGVPNVTLLSIRATGGVLSYV